MNKHTELRATTVAGWCQMVAETWTHLAKAGPTPSANELAHELASRLEMDVALANGLIEGMQTLVQYAQSDWAQTETVLEQERQSVVVAVRSVRPLLQARLQQRMSELDRLHPELWCADCRQPMESQGRRTRQWQSTVGALELTRRYSWCQRCQQGRAVAEEKVGLADSDYTPSLEEIASLMATTVPHQMAVELVRELVGVSVSAKASQSITARRAELVMAQQDESANEIKDYEATWGVRPSVSEATSAVEVAYLEVDGVIVPTRQEVVSDQPPVEGRGGPGRHYELKGREVKNAVLYRAESCAQESEHRRCLLEKTYVSHLGEWKLLALLLWAQMLRLGFDQAKLLVVLSDGAEWIRHLVQWLGLPVLLILDLYHVKHRVWETAATLYGEGTEAATTWARAVCQQIEQGQVAAVIQSLDELKRHHRKAREQIETLQTYLRHNQDRMDYPRYRAMGLRVGSGVVESANYHVTGARLKLPGMRWSDDGAAQMARLRADLFNGCWQQRTRQLLKAA